MLAFSVLSDAVVRDTQRDLLKFDRYVKPLITASNANTPFTIRVFGAWGSGKSNLLFRVDEKLKKEPPLSGSEVKGFVGHGWWEGNKGNPDNPLKLANSEQAFSDKCRSLSLVDQPLKQFPYGTLGYQVWADASIRDIQDLEAFMENVGP